MLSLTVGDEIEKELCALWRIGESRRRRGSQHAEREMGKRKLFLRLFQVHHSMNCIDDNNRNARFWRNFHILGRSLGFRLCAERGRI